MDPNIASFQIAIFALQLRDCGQSGPCICWSKMRRKKASRFTTIHWQFSGRSAKAHWEHDPSCTLWMQNLGSKLLKPSSRLQTSKNRFIGRHLCICAATRLVPPLGMVPKACVALCTSEMWHFAAQWPKSGGRLQEVANIRKLPMSCASITPSQQVQWYQIR